MSNSVTRFEFNDCGGYGGSIPDEIGELTALTYLSLSGRGLTGTVPSQIRFLTALTYLSLAGNLLAEIPREISQMTALTQLWLMQITLYCLPSEVNAMSFPPNNNDFLSNSAANGYTLPSCTADVDCVLGATVGASDCTASCGTITQSITTPATGSGSCAPGEYACQPGDGSCPDVPCSPNTMNPLGLVCVDGTFGSDGKWHACGGYENRVACPIQNTTTPIMCNSGSCKDSVASCKMGVRYGNDACQMPTPSPTDVPTPSPTDVPTPSPTDVPTPSPTDVPTPSPTTSPTPSPTLPTQSPSASPTHPTQSPTVVPTSSPVPTPTPTIVPTPSPTTSPTTSLPTAMPISLPKTLNAAQAAEASLGWAIALICVAAVIAIVLIGCLAMRCSRMEKAVEVMRKNSEVVV